MFTFILSVLHLAFFVVYVITNKQVMCSLHKRISDLEEKN